jgi:hypothetical protein
MAGSSRVARRAWPSSRRGCQRDDCIMGVFNPSRTSIDHLDFRRIRARTDGNNLTGIYKENSRFCSGSIRLARFD